MFFVFLMLRLVAPIVDTRATEKCGCLFFQKSHKPLFFAEGDGGPALMNLDHQDVWLPLVSPHQDAWDGEGPIRYANERYQVTLTKTKIKLGCPEKDDCEYYDVEGTLTVRKGKREEKIRVRGTCGC